MSRLADDDTRRIRHSSSVRYGHGTRQDWIWPILAARMPGQAVTEASRIGSVIQYESMTV
jgi:hypothetical protein